MGWERELFAYLEDLEGQAEAAYDAERVADLQDRGRAEYAEVSLASRLMASLDCDLALEVTGLGTLHGRLERVGRGWILLGGPGQDWLVPIAALLGVTGASVRAVPEVAWPVTARLGLGAALRRLADAVEPCTVHLLDRRRHDGTIGRVGADFVELSSGEPPRDLLVALAGIAAVGSRRG